MDPTEKPLYWIGSSKRDLMELPVPARKFFGHSLHFAQIGEHHDSAKVLRGFGDSGVLEIVDTDSAGAYRAVYTVRFAEAVFVLHCFQKKSKSRIATPKRELDVIHSRLKIAGILAKEIHDGKAQR